MLLPEPLVPVAPAPPEPAGPSSTPVHGYPRALPGTGNGGTGVLSSEGAANSLALTSEPPIGLVPPVYVDDSLDSLSPSTGDYKSSQQTSMAARTPSEKKFLLVITVFGSIFGAGFFLGTLFLFSRAKGAQKRQRAFEKRNSRESKKNWTFLGGKERDPPCPGVAITSWEERGIALLPPYEYQKSQFSNESHTRRASLPSPVGCYRAPLSWTRLDTPLAPADACSLLNAQQRRQLSPPVAAQYNRRRRPSCSSANGDCWCGGSAAVGDRSSPDEFALFTLHEEAATRLEFAPRVDLDACEDEDEDEEEARSRNLLLPPLPVYDPTVAAATTRRYSASSATGSFLTPSEASPVTVEALPVKT